MARIIGDHALVVTGGNIVWRQSEGYGRTVRGAVINV